MTQKKQTQKRSQKQIASVQTIKERMFETDGAYFLKLVVFVLLGTFWIKFKVPVTWLGLPLTAIPVGFALGLLFVNLFEKHQADRKIWYAILIVVTIVCYNAPAGIIL